ncbi:MAG: SPASM domain-containing protein [Bacteroidales bacterium]|nr:SPASM domain-containing protein [Bacteroidales bacterium]
MKDRYKSDLLYVYPGIIVLDEKDKNASMCLTRNNVTDIFFELFRKYGIISERFYPDDINVECMARSPYNNMLVGNDGEIYKCYEDLGNKELIVGNINNTEKWTNYALIAKYATGIDHYNDPICRKCSYLPICRGGCPIRRFENVYAGKHNDCCTPFKGRIQDYVELYSEIMKTNN